MYHYNIHEAVLYRLHRSDLWLFVLADFFPAWIKKYQLTLKLISKHQFRLNRYLTVWNIFEHLCAVRSKSDIQVCKVAQKWFILVMFTETFNPNPKFPLCRDQSCVYMFVLEVTSLCL